MSKTKSHRNKSDTGKDTKQARLAAAHYFVKGDRVRHLSTGALGIFIGLHDGFALPETWVVFDSDTDSKVPISCNPLDLELAQKDSKEHKLLRELGMLGDTQLSFLSPSELHIESDEPATDETPALVDEAAAIPEVTEELADGLSDRMNETGTATKKESVCNMAGTVDDASAAEFEVVEDLSEEEAAERHRLELKVERAFFEAGVALRELRDKRLYRSTHKTFEEYCRERFSFQRAHSYRLIDAASVMDNLSSNWRQNEMSPNRRQILPTKLEQVRPLATLEPDEQCSVWKQAVEQAEGRVPSGRIVKSIVERLKSKPLVKASVCCQVGQVFTLTGLVEKERKYNNCWAIAIGVRDFTLEVEVHDDILTVKPDNLNPVDEPDARRQLPVILKRIKRLRNCGLLDRCAYTVLESLGQQTYLTPLEEKFLRVMESEYGIGDDN